MGNKHSYRIVAGSMPRFIARTLLSIHIPGLGVSLLMLIFCGLFIPQAACQGESQEDSTTTSRLMAAGASYFSSGKYLEAIEKFDSVALLDSSNQEAIRYRYRCNSHLGYYARALEDVERLYGLSHDKKSYYYAKAKTLYSMGEYSDAKWSIMRYNRICKDDPEGWYLRACINMDYAYGDRLEAERNVDRAIKLAGGTYYEALILKGQMAGKGWEANEYYCMAAEADTTKGQPYFLIGKLRLYKKDTAMALKYFDEALQTEPHNESLASSIYETYAKMGWSEKALEGYESILAADSTSLIGLTGLGVLYHRNGDYPMAIRYYDRALGSHPNQPQVLFNKGIALLKTGQKENGKEYIAKAAAYGNSSAIQYQRRWKDFSSDMALQAWLSYIMLAPLY